MERLYSWRPFDEDYENPFLDDLVAGYAEKISKEIEGSTWTEEGRITFSYRGLACRIQVSAHLIVLNGYVTLPKDSPWKWYSDDLDAHGGITYSEGDEIGFDCMHFDDASETQLKYAHSAKTSSIDEVLTAVRGMYGGMKESSFVLEEIKGLVDQILDESPDED